MSFSLASGLFFLLSTRNQLRGQRMSRRRPKGSLQDLLPEDRTPWAKEIWKDHHEVAQLDSGAWLLREAAKTLGIPDEEVDQVLTDAL